MSTETETEIEEKPSIIFSSNHILNIEKKTNVNNKNIYQINKCDCLGYILLDERVEYIGTIYNNIFYIFNLVEDGVFSDIFKDKFKDINNSEIVNSLTSLDYKILIFFHSLQPIFLYIELKLLECPELINLDRAKTFINELNVELNKTCPFKISFDYVLNLENPSFISVLDNFFVIDTLLLCLTNGNNCISSLVIKIDEEFTRIDIDSTTNQAYEGRKFNKLLRSVIIIIAKLIDERIQKIESRAINPISVYSMIQLNAISRKGSIDKTSNFEDIKNLVKRNRYVDTVIKLNRENYENALMIFNKIITTINCTPVSGGKRKKGNNKTNKKGKKENNKPNKSKRIK